MDKIPEQLQEVDFSTLRGLCHAYMEEVLTGDAEDSGTHQYIFEAAIEAVYGEDIFDKWVNPRL